MVSSRVAVALFSVFMAAMSASGQAAPSADPLKDGWISLFNGRDLSGWRADKWNPGGFSVEDGAIKCHGKASMLYYDGPGKEMKDFHFVADVMTKPRANSGIFFHTRYQDRGWPVGHEAQVNTSHGDPVKTGSIYIVAKYLQQATKDNEWFRYEIIVRGNVIATKVNGETLVTYEEKNPSGARKLSSGTIGLQAHDPGSVVYYKNLKILPLTLTRAERVAGRSGKWYDRMDFGPAMQTHVGLGSKVVLKGIAARLGSDEGHTLVYDTEMMSAIAGWKGFLHIAGTAWDGKHGGYPTQSGGNPIFNNDLGPGWANKDGSFEDPRSTGFGPLPADWLKYKGRYVNGDQTVVSYTVGDAQVYELPAFESIGAEGAFVRTVQIPQTGEKMTMRVVNQDGAVTLLNGGEIAESANAPATVKLKPGVNVIVDRSEGDWDSLAMGAPSQKDQANGQTFQAVAGADFAKVHPRAGGDGNRLPRLADGKAAGNQDDVDSCTWFDRQQAAFILDMGKPTEIGRINTYSWHKSDRAPQRFTLSGSVDQQSWQEIAQVDSSTLGEGGKHGSSVVSGDGNLGNFRYLRWQMKAIHQGTFYTEIDVYDAQQKLPAIRIPGSGSQPGALFVGVVGDGVALRQPTPGQVLLDVPAGKRDLLFKLVLAGAKVDLAEVAKPTPLTALMSGGSTQWPDEIAVSGTLGKGKPYVTDDIPLPNANPWASSMRFSGFDFFSDGRLATCTWNGDVWIASGIDADLKSVQWKRYAAGLFETLGLKIVDDVVYVTGKDQITRLHDFNNDGEADFYECFNNDIMITKNFHEFTFDLQTDAAGNFYFAKGAPVRAGGRGFEQTHGHHGIVFKVSKDGKSSEVWSTGLRAPGGLGVGPNGEVTTGENEGTWVPACRITWAAKGSFAGVIHPGNGRTFEQGYDQPLCWLPMTVDNSGGGQVWVNNDQWGPFNGDMLHLSYGRSTVYKVMPQNVDGVMQGGVVALPIRLGSSAMRGRFNPLDKQLYVSGFRGWQTNASKESAIQRVRYTGDPVLLPTALRTTKKGVYLTFTSKLDPELAEDVDSYTVKWWKYVWSGQYGSGHFSVSNPDPAAEAAALTHATKAGGTSGSKVRSDKFAGDVVTVKSATLQPDGKTVFLEIPDIRPVMQMQIKIDVETEDGDVIIATIYNSIHNLAD